MITHRPVEYWIDQQQKASLYIHNAETVIEATRKNAELNRTKDSKQLHEAMKRSHSVHLEYARRWTKVCALNITLANSDGSDLSL